MNLRSIELDVTDLAKASEFLTGTWGLAEAGRSGKTAYFRATGDAPYVMALTEAGGPAVSTVSFAIDESEADALRKRASAAGAKVSATAKVDEPGGGSAFTIAGREGQAYRFVSGAAPAGAFKATALPADMCPSGLAHVVFNTPDRDACTKFMLDTFGFRLSDRTAVMDFVRCDSVHHAIAFARGDQPALNHIAFEMPSTDALMRGIGRLGDAGFSSPWGPGRHGPGNNVFAYFIAPFGATIEYTAEVERVGEDYRTGQPEDWTWPPGRVDHWGISKRDNARLHEAEAAFRFKQAA